MRSPNCIRLLTIMSFVWHLCYKTEVAADIFVNASTAALSSPIGKGFIWSVSTYSPMSPGTAGDMNGDTYPDLMLPNYFGNKVYIVFGTSTGIPQVDVTTMTPTQGITISGPSGIYFGYTSAYVGDVNGDYIDDILIGNNGAGNTAYVIFGKSDGSLTNVVVSSMSSNQGITLTGVTSFGGVVVSAGDVNGDGINDMLVSATGATNPSGVASGVAYVIFGNQNGLSSMNVASLTTAQGFKVYGSASGQTFGSALSAAGDINQDGVADFMVGASGAAAQGVAGAGVVCVLYGRKTGITDIDYSAIVTSQGFIINGFGPTVSRPIGTMATIAAAGDINGDSIGDMIIGQPKYDLNGQYGRVYIIYGRQGTSRSSLAVNTMTSDQGFTITGPSTTSYFGLAVASGDINNDGRKDLVISAYFTEVPSEIANGAPTASGGRVYVFFGHQGSFSNIDLTQNETNYPQTLEYYGKSGTGFGGSVTIGDINGDFVDDIIATSTSVSDTTLLYGTTCNANDQCSDSSLHPVCYASLGCECGKISKKFQVNQCVAQCSDGYYPNGIFCQSCPSICKTCTDANTCQSCNSPNLLQGTSCVATCSQGYTSNGTNCIVPVTCPNTCATCSDATTCLTCNGANLLQGTSCVASCDPGYTQSGASCIVNSGSNTGGGNTGGNAGGNSGGTGGNTGGTTSGGASSSPETTTADSSSNHAGLIIGVVVGGVVFIICATIAFYYLFYKRAVIAKLTRVGITSESPSSTVQITDNQKFIRLDTVKGDAQSPQSLPQSPSASPESSQSLIRHFPQTTQTLKVLKVEVEP